MSDPSDIIHREYAPAFFGLLATRVIDTIVSTGGTVFADAGILAPVRTTSTLLLLARHELSVTEIAAALSVTHAAVIKNSRALIELGLVERGSDPNDARRKPLRLTEKGREQAAIADRFMREAGDVYRNIFEEIGVDAFDALSKMEEALKRQSFSDRHKALFAVKSTAG